MKGKLILFSGIDGSGKTTVAEKLKSYLIDMGISRVIVVDAMKDGIYTPQLKCITCNESIRNIYSSAMLNLTWTADLIYNMNAKVLPALESGTWVLLHRTDLCCRVYSELFSPYDRIPSQILEHIAIPSDLHFHLSLSPHTAYQRILRRSFTRHNISEKEKLELLTKADQLYSQYLKTELYKDVICLDAEKPIDFILEDMSGLVNTLFDRTKVVL